MIIIFSGTTEGRKISEYLSAKATRHIVCVATESGENVMSSSDFADVHVGRMSADDMEAFFEKNKPDAVIDATHPYAEIVTSIIKNVCEKMSIKYLRVSRSESVSLEGTHNTSFSDMFMTYKNTGELVETLKSTTGNILLTTGSKELACFTQDDELRDRIYARVLPTIDSIELCRQEGIDERHIIAMYGPHTTAMNEAVLQQFDIRHMVTKSSGTNGGYEEKLLAAKNCGVTVHVIERPTEKQIKIDASSLDNQNMDSKVTVVSSVDECITWLENNSFIEAIVASGETTSSKRLLKVSLVGIGMGNIAYLTLAGKEIIEVADIVYGANRMLSSLKDIIRVDAITKSIYMPDDIISDLKDQLTSVDDNGDIHVAILFSGDTGIYSGAIKLHRKLCEWGRCDEINILPGISSFSAFAASLGVDYTHARLESLHGKSDDEDNLNRISNLVAELIDGGDEVWLLMSGRADFNVLKNLIRKAIESTKRIGENFQIGIDIGYNISYENQKIFHGVIDCASDNASSSIWDEVAVSEEGLFITRLFAVDKGI